jgi:hypothetical protein
MDERNVLHITLGNALDSSLDAPQRFNELPAAERVRIARQALAQAGAINMRVAPGSLNLVEGPPARAMDAVPRPGAPRKQLCSHDGLFGHICGPSGITEEPVKDGGGTRAARLHAALDQVLDVMPEKRRRARKQRPERDLDNRVAADARTIERMARRDKRTVSDVRTTRDAGELAMGNHGNMGEFRKATGLDTADDGSEGAYFARCANLTCGLGA